MWKHCALEPIRLAELEALLPHFPEGARVLEIGAGAGWQARALADRGFIVEAIEYSDSGFSGLREARVFPVQDYDGHRIPFPDGSFDVVFSSNVLEHIPHVERFQAEIQRVLRSGGTAVHLMPTATWRIWTTLAHYPYVLGRMVRRRRTTPNRIAPTHSGISGSRRHRWTRRLIWALLPERHGEIGNVLTEVLLFSRWRWRRLFERTGYATMAEAPNGIFYTGYGLLQQRLSLRMRRCVSSVLGSACRAWVLRVVDQGPAHGL